MVRSVRETALVYSAIIHRLRYVPPEERRRVIEMVKTEVNNDSQTIDQCFENLVKIGVSLPISP